MSSAIPVTAGRSPKVSSIFFWKTSWAQIRPRGSLRKRYLPCGELKVVHSELSWSSFIFHNPLRASKIEKYFAPHNLGRISSNAGVRWCGRWIARLTCLGQRHNRSVPFILVTRTKEFTQSVSSSTFFSGTRSASGTRRGW